MKKLKINKCKSKYGRYNLDNNNVIIEVDVELDTKEITKNVALRVENLIKTAPELLDLAKDFKNYLNEFIDCDQLNQLLYEKVEEIIAKAEN
ncbi:MAG: hypothetical protein ACOCRX_05100 [Candidatus Woesearchaeota archaeon]